MSCSLICILKTIQPIRLFRPLPQLRSLEYDTEIAGQIMIFGMMYKMFLDNALMSFSYYISINNFLTVHRYILTRQMKSPYFCICMSKCYFYTVFNMPSDVLISTKYLHV